MRQDIEVNAVDNAGWTPLFEAIREHKEGTTLDVIRALVAAGADVNAKSPPDDGGGTVLHNLASKAHYMAIAKVMPRNTYSTHTNYAKHISYLLNFIILKVLAVSLKLFCNI